MRSHRTVIFIGVLVVALAAALPGAALASPLLSGYGGPGQGSQAILGSALLNGPKGGAGSGGSGSAAVESGTTSATSGSGGESSSGAGSSAPVGKGASRARSHARQGAEDRQKEGARTAPTGRPSFYPVAERVPSGVGGATLGLSGADLIYIILTVGVLLSLGLLTRRVGVADRQEGAGS